MRAWAIGMAVAFALTACSGGGDNSSSNTGGTGGTAASGGSAGSDSGASDAATDGGASDAAPDGSASDAATDGGNGLPNADALDAMGLLNAKAAFLDAQNLGNTDEGAALIAYAKTLTAVVDAKMAPEDSGVVVTLEGGIDFSIDLEWRNFPDTGAVPNPPFDPPPTKVLHLPSGKQAVVMAEIGLPAGAYLSAWHVWGFLHDAGYDVHVGHDTLENLASMLQDVDVFYVTAHNDDCLETSTVVTDQDNDTIENVYGEEPTHPKVFTDSVSNRYYQDKGFDFVSGPDQEVAYISSVFANPVGFKLRRLHYCVKPKFFDNRASFHAHSLVLMDACRSNANSGFSDAVMGTGAARFVGWNHDAPIPDSWHVSNRFLDRLLEANVIDPLPIPERSFDFDQTYAKMKAKGELTAQGKEHGKPLVSDLVASPGENILLRPGISELGTNAVGDTMRIWGQFGVDPGTVTVGGTKVSCTWPSADGAPIDLCHVPKGVFGDVVVSVHGIHSKPMQLAHWTPTFHYTQYGPGTLKTDIKIHLDFRGDALEYRSAPEQDPDSWPNWAAFWVDRQKTSCEINISGSYSCDAQSGSKTVPFTAGQCDVQIAFDSGLKKLVFKPVVTVVGAGTTCCICSPCNNVCNPMTAQLAYVPGLVDISPSTWTLDVDQHTGQLVPHTLKPVTTGSTFSVEWLGPFKPDAAPSDDTRR